MWEHPKEWERVSGEGPLENHPLNTTLLRAKLKDGSGYTDWPLLSNIHFEIDTSTLAISFEDMTDKNDKRIFAALNKNGVGGDMFKKQYVFVYIRGTLYFIDTTFAGVEVPRSVFRPSDFEVTGIYEGNQR